MVKILKSRGGGGGENFFSSPLIESRLGKDLGTASTLNMNNKDCADKFAL